MDPEIQVPAVSAVFAKLEVFQLNFQDRLETISLTPTWTVLIQIFIPWEHLTLFLRHADENFKVLGLFYTLFGTLYFFI